MNTVLALALTLAALAWVAYALVLDVRRRAVLTAAADIERIEEGFVDWNHHTPNPPLRAVSWPERETPTDLAAAYQPIPWTDPDWALREVEVILATNRRYVETLVDVRDRLWDVAVSA